MAEQLTLNQWVIGSIPITPTTQSKALQQRAASVIMAKSFLKVLHEEHVYQK